jgi:hypothetical protein
MAFNFPNAPADGALFTPNVGGPTYAWSAALGVWSLTSGGLSAGVYIGDSPPASPVIGQLWWESDSGNTYIWYGDATSTQWVQFNTGLLPDVPSVPKVTRFAASGTWTPDPKMLHGFAVGKGGGGAGGGFNVVLNANYGCCGGGEGQTATKYFRKSDITNPTYAVTIGAGGVAVSGGQGGTGGDSIVAGLLTAKGGVGGSLYSPGWGTAAGGVGDIITYGITGGTGNQGPTTSSIPGWSGNGGGTGGGQGVANGTGGTWTAGNVGSANSGGGGSGAAACNAGPGPVIGGNGGSGLAYIVEYCTP